MRYKAKKSYKDLENSENFLSLGSASKHLWLLDDKEIEFNGKVPEKLKKHLEECKPSKKKGDK